MIYDVASSLTPRVSLSGCGYTATFWYGVVPVRPCHRPCVLMAGAQYLHYVNTYFILASTGVFIGTVGHGLPLALGIYFSNVFHLIHGKIMTLSHARTFSPASMLPLLYMNATWQASSSRSTVTYCRTVTKLCLCPAIH